MTVSDIFLLRGVVKCIQQKRENERKNVLPPLTAERIFKMISEAIFFEEGDTLRVLLPCEIDHHVAKPIREEVDTKIFMISPRLLVLDFSNVSFMDSSGIGLILGRAVLCDERGCRVNLFGLSRTLMKLVRLSGIEKIKNISISD